MSSDKKTSIKVNFILNTSYQLLAIIIPLVTTPYLSRILGAERIGVFSFSHSVANYFVVFAMLGVSNYGNRSIAAVSDDKQKRSKTFLSIYSFQLITSILSVFLYVIYSVFVSSEKTISLIFLLFVVSSAFDINWFFWGLEKFKITTIRNTFVKLFTVIGIFLFVKTKDDVWLYAFIYSFGILISQVVMWLSIKKYIKFVRISFQDVIDHIKPNLVLFIPVIAVSLYKYMDKIMLGVLANNTEVGYYESSDKMILVPCVLINSLGTVMMPRISNLIAHNRIKESMIYLNKSIVFESMLASSMCFGIIAVAPEFVPFYYGPGFDKCIVLFEILLPSCIFFGFANVIRTQYLMPNHKDKEYIISVLGGALVNLLLNAILIPFYGSAGAAIATLIAEATVCIIQSIQVRNDMKIPHYILISIPAILSGIVMMITLRLINLSGIQSIILQIILKTLIGGVLFLLLYGLLFILKRKRINK